MSIQEQELDEARAMMSDTPDLYLLVLRELYQANNARDLYKARYECLKKFVQVSCRIPEYDWCELTSHAVLSVEKDCKTVDEVVDFVLGGGEYE